MRRIPTFYGLKLLKTQLNIVSLVKYLSKLNTHIQQKTTFIYAHHEPNNKKLHPEQSHHSAHSIRAHQYSIRQPPNRWNPRCTSRSRPTRPSHRLISTCSSSTHYNHRLWKTRIAAYLYSSPRAEIRFASITAHAVPGKNNHRARCSNNWNSYYRPLRLHSRECI